MDKQFYLDQFKVAESKSYERELMEKMISLKMSLQALVRSVQELDVNNAKRDVEWIKESYNLNDAKACLDALDQHEWDHHVALMEMEV